MEKSISILIEAQTYGRDFLLEQRSIHPPRIIMKKEKTEKIDELDLKILKSISLNARKPIIEIAQEIKSTVRSVNYRIKQLIKKEIILGFKIALNYELLGLKFYKTFIYLDNPKKERIKELLNYLASQKNITHNVRVIGNWDLEPEFEVYSEKEFDSILTELKDKFKDTIKKIEIITITKEHKFVYF
jgi:DNA-binding Lrp family transcriptional regulator